MSSEAYSMIIIIFHTIKSTLTHHTWQLLTNQNVLLSRQVRVTVAAALPDPGHRDDDGVWTHLPGALQGHQG